MKKIEYYLDCSSPWTYLSFRGILELRKNREFEIIWKPILVGGIFNSTNPSVYESRKNPVKEKLEYSQKDMDARASQLANMKTYREKRDSVRDNVVNIIHSAKEKNPNMTPELAAELEQDINNYVRSMGLSSKDFITATPSTLLAEDEFGFYTSSPNPYPAIEYTQVYASNTMRT